MSELKVVTKEQHELLREPLPEEALSQMAFGSKLTSIRPIYITERLNRVFGVGIWRQDPTPFLFDGLPYKEIVDSKGKECYLALVDMVFTIPSYGIYYRVQASSTNYDPGDALKGASSDCLSKIASYMDIAHDVFKGKGIKEKENLSPKSPMYTTLVQSLKDKSITWPEIEKDYTVSSPIKRMMNDAAKK